LRRAFQEWKVVMSAIDRLIEGSIDVHVHFGPDPLVERRADAMETAQRAKEMGMRGLVLKSHQYSTAPLAYAVSRIVPGLEVMGGLCLDVEVGGLNPMAVEATSLAMSAQSSQIQPRAQVNRMPVTKRTAR